MIKLINTHLYFLLLFFRNCQYFVVNLPSLEFFKFRYLVIKISWSLKSFLCRFINFSFCSLSSYIFFYFNFFSFFIDIFLVVLIILLSNVLLNFKFSLVFNNLLFIFFHTSISNICIIYIFFFD